MTYGSCKRCGEPANGHHFGGSSGYCSRCERENNKSQIQRLAEAREEAVEAVMRKYNCSKEDAIVIIRKNI